MVLKVAGGGGVAGGVIYAGTWNASTNDPTLTSGVGTKGEYYVVSVAGSTNLDGITDMKVDREHQAMEGALQRQCARPFSPCYLARDTCRQSR